MIWQHPQLFKLIKFPHFWAKHVDNHIARINQNPVALVPALDSAQKLEFLLDPSRQFVGKRRHLPGRAAGTDDHMVGNFRFAAQINRNYVLGLVVIKC